MSGLTFDETIHELRQFVGDDVFVAFQVQPLATDDWIAAGTLHGRLSDEVTIDDETGAVHFVVGDPLGTGGGSFLVHPSEFLRAWWHDEDGPPGTIQIGQTDILTGVSRVKYLRSRPSTYR